MDEIKRDKVIINRDGTTIDNDAGWVEVVQGFNYWMDGFWKVIAGDFRERDHVKVEEYTFTEIGCNCIIPDVECPVQKTWYTLTQPTSSDKFNRANVSWVDGILVIQADIQEAPCTIKWFNIY